MIIPKDPVKRLEFFQEVVRTCEVSREDRIERYAMFRNYYLYGRGHGETQSAWNNVYPTIDLLTSFLYAADTTRFSVKLGSGAPKSELKRAVPMAKRILEKWNESNASEMFKMTLEWALVYDSCILKFIRRGNTAHPFFVDPGCFGVYREDVSMLDRQEAFVHWYYMSFPELERALTLHPQGAKIINAVNAARQKKDTPSEAPGLVERVVLSAVEPTMMGEANISLDVIPDYKADIAEDLVEMAEVYIWNDEIEDYQVVTMADNEHVIYDRQNFFMPKSSLWEAESGFVQVCPNPLPDYFWGRSEVAKLVPIQDRLQQRMDEIERLLAKAVDPPAAWTGNGINEEKLDALQDPGAMISIGGDPTTKNVVFGVTVPTDVYRDVEKIEAQFLLASGLTNVLLGRGESGVRSSGHANKLANLGSARPKQRALQVEGALEKAATILARCAYMDDDKEIVDEDDHKFILAQTASDFTVEVDGHSNSPVFMENQREDALILFKSRAISRERLIEMLAPPQTDQLVRELRTKIIPNEQAAEQQKAAAIAAGERAKSPPKLSSVG